MYLEYSIYIFIIFCLELTTHSHAHTLPKGFHLSRSCQPQCRSGTICVVYRDDDGAPHSTCKYIDPHNSALDGTLIITPQNNHKATRDSDKTKANFARRSGTDMVNIRFKLLPDIGVKTVKAADTKVGKSRHTLFKSMPDTGVKTVKAVDTKLDQSRHIFFKELPNDGFTGKRVKADSNTDQRKRFFSDRSLLDTAIPRFGQQNRNRFDSIVKKSNNSTVTNASDDTANVLTSQNKQPAVNFGRASRKLNFEGITLVRTADGRVAFRRLAKPHSSNTGNKAQVNSHDKQRTIDSSSNKTPTNMTTDRNDTFNRSTSSNQSEAMTDVNISGNMEACKPCDHDCPPGMHCFLSFACARQICQYL